MGHEESHPRVGVGPYRSGPVTPPSRPPSPPVVAGFGDGGLALVNLLRLVFGASEKPVAVGPAAIERASSLAGGQRVMAVFADRDPRHTEVLRVPGEPRRRGADTVVAPDALAGHGAVAVLEDGVHLRDARGELLRVQGAEVRALPGVEVAPFVNGYDPDAVRVVARAGDFASLRNGWLVQVRGEGVRGRPLLALEEPHGSAATDGATVCAALGRRAVWCADAASWHVDGGPNAPSAAPALRWQEVTALAGGDPAQVAVAGDVVCTRGHGGDVACAKVTRAALRESPWLAAEPSRLYRSGDDLRATALALSRDDLCVLDAYARLHCVHGPQEDAAAPLGASALHLRAALEGVTEVGLADGVGCARQGGRVVCWGPLVRSGWVTWRDRPVRIEGLREPVQTLARGGLVCVRDLRGVSCWGVGASGARHPRPVLVDGVRGDGALNTSGDCLCVDGDATRCWRDVGAGAPAPTACPTDDVGPFAPTYVSTPWGSLPLAESADHQCVVTPRGEVACHRGPLDSSAPFSAPTIPGLDDANYVTMTREGLACADRRDGSVWCWGDNTSGALTAAEAERSPRVVAITVPP